MQSGIAPWPGKTTRSALLITAGSEVMTTLSFGATCSIALATERRLPIPKSTMEIIRFGRVPDLQRPLGRGDRSCGTRVDFDGHPQRPGKGLEDGLALVVRVVAAQVVDVQRDQRVIDEALEELVREVDVELADHRPREAHVP